MIPVSLRQFYYGLFGRFNDKDLSPIILVGSGRSGTTLLHEILSSHTEIVGFPSEANELWHPNSYPIVKAKIDTPPFWEDPHLFTQLSLDSWPLRHEEKIKRIFSGCSILNGKNKQFFVKSAMISFMLPRIYEMFPTAKFVHIYRFGPSVVESWYKKEVKKYPTLSKNPKEYKMNRSLYWNKCIFETGAFAEKYSAPYLEFSYEALCDSPHEILDKLSQFIEIDPSEFSFDISSIISQNQKTTHLLSDPEWKDFLEVMKPVMEMKGYF